MAIQVKHTKVSTVPDDTDTSLVRPSDWNADHTLVGTIDVPNGGTGASTLTGYVKGNGTSAMTASATIPSGDVTGLGTMSTQNANAVAITGGTINGTTIGATSATTVNATTLSGETGVLRGTGTNLLLRSQALTTSPWSLNNAPTTASTTDPLGGSTATQFTTSSAGSGVFQTLTGTSGVTYTWSMYIKYISGDGNVKIGNDLAPNTASVVFNSSAGTITSTGAGITASSVTNIGSGWYRVSGTFVSTGTPMAVVIYSNNSNAMSWAAWGVQYEVGTSMNTYIPTTTTAVYGTPTLSFSGVSTLGLESNGALFLQPAGTGAIQAQATTSTTAGGNVRGANAVDWQTSRGSAGQVASAVYSVLSGGQSNTSSGAYGFVGGGVSNTVNNQVAGVVGGQGNTATQQYAMAVGGYFNSSTGWFNFIGNGQSNSGTANGTVTTQSGTMNATTAVTLSGSNASIKVGQLIQGTSIGNYTYVAAISGTSLTLSQAATGSSTSTLSFFTPHGVVVGGGNNQATGSYSFIGGGGDAGTAANRNVASGDWSFVGGGTKNVASGAGSVIAGGGLEFNTAFGNTASGTSSFVGGGILNNASNSGSTITGGWQHTANGGLSTVVGGRYGTVRSISGNIVFPACNIPVADASGVSQAALLILGTQTTNATATALRSDANAASTINQVILPNNSAYFFTGEVVSGVTGGGNTKGWTIEGVIKRGANAASTTLVGTPTVTSMYADVGAATWAIAVTADTTNGGLRVTFTGQAATTIRTVCQIRTTEMTY